MKWVTYLDADGERTGVLSDDAIYAMPAGVTLLDLIGRGADGLRAAGDEVLRAPAATVPLGAARLLAPIPHPPSIRDSLCFLDHMRNCQVALGAGGDSPTPGIGSRRSISPVLRRCSDRTMTCRWRQEVLGRTLNWRLERSSERSART